MATPTATRITGLREAIADLDALGRDVSELRAAHDDIATDVEADARSRVRVRSGRLKSTIRRLSDPSAALVAAGGGGVDYATVEDRKTGFLKGPGNENVGERAATLEQHLERLIRQHHLS